MRVKLENARLCVNCETIYDEDKCPTCTSETYFVLRNLLGTTRFSIQEKVYNETLNLTWEWS